MKRIAILGSSGGNLYNLGGKEPLKLLGEIQTQARAAGIEIVAIQFIGAHASMDKASSNTPAKLYTWNSTQEQIDVSEQAALEKINELAQEQDQAIAEQINNGEVDGLVLVSADPKGANRLVVQAAAAKRIPIVGTGGTSMATVQALGGHVIATSGTTGTTNRTRAIAAIQALSKNWGLKYKPTIGSSGASEAKQDESVWDRISFRGIMMAALPGFIALALVLALSKVPAFSALGEAFNILIGGLPVIVAALAAKQASGLDEVGIVSGVVAGMLSAQGD